MRLRFGRRALRQLDRIHDYIAANDATAAIKVIDDIYASLTLLISFPEIGRRSVTPGLREWIIPGLPYVAVYRASPATRWIEIVAVYHTAQNRPR